MMGAEFSPYFLQTYFKIIANRLEDQCLLTNQINALFNQLLPKCVVRARINPEIKEKASEYLASIGLTISDLIRITITKTANKQALPFDEIPNKETELALKESVRGVGVHKAKDIDDLFSQLENDDE